MTNSNNILVLSYKNVNIKSRKIKNSKSFLNVSNTEVKVSNMFPIISRFWVIRAVLTKEGSCQFSIVNDIDASPLREKSKTETKPETGNKRHSQLNRNCKTALKYRFCYVSHEVLCYLHLQKLSVILPTSTTIIMIVN